MLDIKQGLLKKYPLLKTISPLGHTVAWVLRKILHQDACNHIIDTNSHKPPFAFNRSVLDAFSAEYTVKHLENIPETGPVIIIANHPLGALEALALLDLTQEVREDVKIVANELLMYIEPLQPLFLPVDNMNAKTAKASIVNINKALKNNEAVIIFPAGEVSRKTKEGIVDSEWNRGFLRFAKRVKAPILPIKIDATNSWYFYTISHISKPFSSLLLADQMFRRKGKPMQVTISQAVPFETYNSWELSEEALSEKFKQALYAIPS